MALRIEESENLASGILFIGFNQDYTCFSVGMKNCFRIYNTDPLQELQCIEFDPAKGTGVGYVEMLQRSAVVALLGGGPNPCLPETVGAVWDGTQNQFVLELESDEAVLSIRMTENHVILITSTSASIHTSDAHLLCRIKTCNNPRGLCQVGGDIRAQNPILALPAPTGEGRVRVGKIPLDTSSRLVSSRDIDAHGHPLAALTINRSGSLLATASTKGTLVRVFDLTTAKYSRPLLYELRRGANPTVVTSLAFNDSSKLLAMASMRQTLHVFELETATTSVAKESFTAVKSDQKTTNSQQQESNSAVSISGLWAMLPNKSQIQCILKTKQKSICAFSPIKTNTLIAISCDGSYFKYTFKKSGQSQCEKQDNFLNLKKQT